MLKIAIVFGTRPEIIKLAPVVRWARSKNEFDCLVVSTGQHSSLRDIAIAEEGIMVDKDLNLMVHDQSPSGFTASAIQALDQVFAEQNIDGVIVQGDTSTAVAGALAGFYSRIPVFHVEAGLRSGNINNPFPEEANRRIIGQLASLSFAPTTESVQNLLASGIDSKNIVLSGNTIVDSLFEILKNLDRLPASSTDTAREDYSDYVLCTAHRRENHEHLGQLIDALEILAKEMPNICFWVPVHPNPNVAREFDRLRGFSKNLVLMPPVNHQEFVRLLNRSDLVLSDSGGVQEEAVSLGKKILVLRETTERPEVLSSGLGQLVKFNTEAIVDAVTSNLSQKSSGPKGSNPFGDGNASSRICAAIVQSLR